MLLHAARLTARQLMTNTKGAPLLKSLPARQVTLVASAVKPPSELGHDEGNMKIGRPMSPHLSVYSPQLTSILSITHRITGVALGGALLAFGAASAVLPITGVQYVDAIQSLGLGGVTMFCIKYVLAYPFAFHTCNGIRHLSWDTGRFLTIKNVYLGGYLMLAVTTAVAIALALVGQ